MQLQEVLRNHSAAYTTRPEDDAGLVVLKVKGNPTTVFVSTSLGNLPELPEYGEDGQMKAYTIEDVSSRAAALGFLEWSTVPRGRKRR